MSNEQHRPCERKCRSCGRFKHHSRYRSWRRDGTVSTSVTFATDCKDCEQKIRNERKNADRPRAIIEQRARSAAQKAGASFEFFMVEMNYRSLVPILRALMTDEGLCLGCGHEFVNERDIQIEHCEPPQHPQDWARLHTRNVRLFCASCNNTKGKKSFSQWLDEQEECRLSNKRQPSVIDQPTRYYQPSLFDPGPPS